jgi:hypothetical protein
MANYVDAGTQTRWAGLTQNESIRPEALFSPRPDTSTPPDDMMMTEKVEFNGGGRRRSVTTPEGSPTQQHHHREPVLSTSPLLARRLNRPEFVAHIDLPSPDLAALDDEVPISPPASAAMVLSPLPEANKRFAGHTPMLAGSPSQKFEKKAPNLQPHPNFNVAIAKAEQLRQYQAALPPDDENQAATPQQDIGLTGPLMLAPNPGDGAADHIALDVLDQELSKIAQLQLRDQSDHDDDDNKGLDLAQQESSSHGSNQQNARGPTGMPPLHSTGNSALSSRKGSADSRRSEDVAPVDGVTLKRAPLNFGAPFGEM